METVIYLILGVLGFFIFMQLFMRIASFTKKGKKITVINGDLGRKIKSGAKSLVYFYSPT